MMRPVRIVCTMSLALAGCGTVTGDTQRAAIRDSVGIRIVENEPLAPDAPPVVLLSEQPILVLGELDGPAAQQFGSVVGAMRLASGELVIADGKNRQLRLFDTTGAFLRTIGQRGEGPGDFGALAGLLPSSDGIIQTWDYVLRRITRFEPAGTVRSIESVARPEVVQSPNGMRASPGLNPVARWRDGRLLALGGRLRMDPPAGIRQDTLTVSALDTVGGISPILEFAGGSSWSYNFPDGNIWFDSLAYGRRGRLVVTDTALIVSDGSAYEVRSFDGSGRWTGAVRVLQSRRPVGASERQRVRATAFAEAGSDGHDKIKEILDWLVYPDSMPAYDQLAMDANGVLWARVFPDTASAATWDLFGTDATLLGIARVPADLVIREIGADYLLAQRKGELDEPLVVLYRLQREH